MIPRHPLVATGALVTLLSLTPFDLSVAASQPGHAFAVFGFQRTRAPERLLRDWHQRTETVLRGGRAEREGPPKIRRIREAPALPSPIAERRMRYTALIDAEAARHDLDPELVHAVIRAESNYRSKAKSPAGACGLMQLMPATARRFGVTDIWDPEQNIRGGIAYLRFLVERFDGDLNLVLAAYNAGEGAVAKYGNRIPPYRETRTYVSRVLGFLGKT